MTSPFVSQPARHCLALILAFLLCACGGGGGSPGITDNAVLSGAGAATATLAPVTVFSAALNGTQEVPGVATAATGTGAVIVDPNTRLMRVTLVTSGVRGTAATINQGAPGINGPTLLPLAETAAASGVWIATTMISADQLVALQSGNLYFNVQSAGFPGGEIRGQILARLPQSTATAPVAIATAITAVMTGAQEAPPNGSGAVAAGTMLIDPNARALNAAVTTFGIAATAVSIREAPAGQNGPPVFSLAETSPGSGIWTIQTLLGSAQLSAALAGNYYFQAASIAFPNGEVRGQISPPTGFPPAAPASASVPNTTPASGPTSGTTTGNTPVGTAGSASGIGTTTGTAPVGGVGSSSGIGSMDIGSAPSPGTVSGIGTGTGTGTGSVVGIGTPSGIGTSTGTGSAIGAGTTAGAGMTGIMTTAGF